MGGAVTKKKDLPNNEKPLRRSMLQKVASRVNMPNSSTAAAAGISENEPQLLQLNTAPTIQTQNAKLEEKPEKKLFILAQPLSTCMVPSKHLPKTATSVVDKTRDARSRENSNGVSTAGAFTDSDSGAFWGTALSALKVADVPSVECNACDCNESTRADQDTSNREQSHSSQSVNSKGIDERATRLFFDYLSGHAIGFRGPRDILWFNLDYDRALLKRRDRPSLIVWNPLEEIALNEEDSVSKEGSGVLFDFDENDKIGAAQKSDEIEFNVASRHESSLKSRIRPIISNNVSHRSQLATKAIEDNYLFIQARAPKFCR